MQITRKQHQYQHQPGKTILVCLRDDENEHHNEQHKQKEKEKQSEREGERDGNGAVAGGENLPEESPAQRQSTGAQSSELQALCSYVCVCLCASVAISLCVCKKFNEDICYSQCTLKLFCGKQRSHWWHGHKEQREEKNRRGKKEVGARSACACCCWVSSSRQTIGMP